MKKHGYFAVCFSLSLLACGGASPSPAKRAVAVTSPNLGDSGSGDTADLACTVVLRSVYRDTDGQGGYQTRCDPEGELCSWSWIGTVDVATSAVEGGASVAVLYHRTSDATWWEVSAVAVGAGGPGYTRFSFRLDDHVLGPDAGSEELELIPILRVAAAERLFDHNHHPGALDNYRLRPDRGYQIWDDHTTCSHRPDTGAIEFTDDWRSTVIGEIRAGGRLAVHYDLDRLPGCRATHNGYPAWGTTAYVRFLPGGELASGSVRAFVSDMGIPTNEAYPVPFEVEVPALATGVEIWFKNDSGAGNFCETWDSNWGRNYYFGVLPPTAEDPCHQVERWDNRYGGDAFCPDYEIAAHYDATNCEFTLNGFGDGYEGHYGIPYRWIEAYLHVGSNDGAVLGAGMFVEYLDHGDATGDTRIIFGKEIEAGVWETGFNYLYTGYMGSGSHSYEVERFAFFVDVRRGSGEVVRLWHSRGGADYRWDDAFSLPTTIHSIPYGHVDYAADGAAVFDSRRTCQ